MPVDPRSDRAVHKQLADILRDGILAGVWPPGTMLPSENRLAQEQAVGREAIRQAVAALRHEGLVSTARGSGSMVRETPVRSPVKIGKGDRVVARMPMEPERMQYDVEEGVPLLEIYRADGEKETHAGDRAELVGE